MKYMKHILMAALLLVGTAGSAQAIECIAQAANPSVRAEGITEQIGTITVRCRGSRTNAGLDFQPTTPTKLEIEVMLNTDITNDRSDDMIANMDDATGDDDGSETKAGYHDGDVVLTALALGDDQATTGTELDGNFSDGAVSDDLRKVTWKVVDIDTTPDGIADEVGEFQLAPTTGNGFEFKVAGLRADASGVGDGNKITASVKVNGSAVGSAMDAASVMTGIDASVKAGKGKECNDGAASATITIKEGFKAAFKGSATDEDNFLVTFKNIPEGVDVMVPTMVKLVTEDEDTNVKEAVVSFSLTLVEGQSGDGVGKPDKGMAKVELSATGTGEVRYKIGVTTREATADDVTAGLADAVGDTITESTVDDKTEESAKLPISLSWDGGDVVMNADAMVYVAFYPAGGSSTPRFAGDGDADTLLTIEDCITKLTFPFVSSASGYDTGIVVSNTKDASGSCTATYSGSEDTMSSPVIEGNSHWIFLVSTHMADYSGRLMVECDFGGIDGYAQINDHMGNANGYLPRME